MVVESVGLERQKMNTAKANNRLSKRGLLLPTIVNVLVLGLYNEIFFKKGCFLISGFKGDGKKIGKGQWIGRAVDRWALVFRVAREQWRCIL